MDRTKPWSIALTLSLIIPALTLGLLVAPAPLSPVGYAVAADYAGPCTAQAAEISDQSKEMELRLYRESEDRLTTDLDYGTGENNQIQLAPGQSVDFRLDRTLVHEMILSSVDVGGDLVATLDFWGSTSSFSGGEANMMAILWDGSTEIGRGETDPPMDNTPLTSESYDIDIEWDDPWKGEDPSYTVQEDHRFTLELINDDDQDSINFDYDIESDAETRLTMNFQSVACLEVSTEMLDLATDVVNDRIDTDHFEPNLPADHSKIFVWGSDDDDNDRDIDYDGGLLDSLGRDNLEEVRVLVYRDGEEENPYFDEEADLSNSTNDDWLNYEVDAWDYSEESLDWGSHYNVEVQAIDLQGNIFNRIVPITMDQWGAYMYLPDDDPQGDVSIGGSRELVFRVRNSGGDPDTFTVSSSVVPNNWTLTPQDHELSINPGQEKEARFTLYAPTDDDFVGDSAVIIFTAESEQAPSVRPKEFKITTTTRVGAQYEVELYFLVGDTVTHENSVSAQMNKPNEFNFTLANLGQDTDSFEIEGIWPGDVFDWKADFYFETQGDLADNPYLVEDIPRKDNDDPDQNKAELVAVVEPATGGTIETARLTIKATSQGNTSSTHEIYLTVTRSKGVTLKSDKPYIANGVPNNPVTFDLTIESSQEGDHTYKLTANTPSGISGKFTDSSGSTLVDITLERDERKSIRYRVDDLPDDITYKDGGYVISLLAEDVADGDVRFPLSVSFNIAQNVKFSLDGGKTRLEGSPDETIVFKLEITNDGNTQDTFVITTKSVPGGYGVKFSPSATVVILPEQTKEITIQVSIPNDALNGQKRTVEIEVKATNADQTQTQKYTLEIKADFGERMQQAIEDNWYLLMLAPLLIIGYIVWSRSVAYEDEEEEGDETYGASSPARDDDDFDEWD